MGAPVSAATTWPAMRAVASTAAEPERCWPGPLGTVRVDAVARVTVASTESAIDTGWFTCGRSRLDIAAPRASRVRPPRPGGALRGHQPEAAANRSLVLRSVAPALARRNDVRSRTRRQKRGRDSGSPRGGTGPAADEPYEAGRAGWLEPDERAAGSRAPRVAVEPARIAQARGESRNPTPSRGGVPACGVRLGSRRARPAGDSESRSLIWSPGGPVPSLARFISSRRWRSRTARTPGTSRSRR